jgi:hypothetical protein
MPQKLVIYSSWFVSGSLYWCDPARKWFEKDMPQLKTCTLQITLTPQSSRFPKFHSMEVDNLHPGGTWLSLRLTQKQRWALVICNVCSNSSQNCKQSWNKPHILLIHRKILYPWCIPTHNPLKKEVSIQTCKFFFISLSALEWCSPA